MNTKLIEKLKDPKQAQPFGLRSPEEQDVLDKASRKNCLYYGFTGWNQPPDGTGVFTRDVSYILEPDYEPEPEYEDRPVELGGSGLLEVGGVSIHCLLSWPDFVEFFYGADRKSVRIGHIAVHDVATAIREGHKVYARFVKEG